MSGEAQVIARAQGGDRSAFSTLVRTHQRRIYATALRMMGNHAAADDVTQDVFLRAFRSLPAFDGRSELSTWLYRIAINTSINHLRKRKKHDTIEGEIAKQIVRDGDSATVENGAVSGLPSSSQRDPRREVEVSGRLGRVLEAIAQLSETLRVTLVLATVEGLPYRRIAELLDIPEGTVAWRVNEARKRIKQRVASDDQAPHFSDGQEQQKTVEERGNERV